ncbi:MAG: glycoside hydrolase family 19 protein [Lysobacteraceae bacterium]
MLSDAILAAATGAPAARAARWGDAYRGACAEFGIDTPRRMACFFGQLSHESNALARVEENLNYSAQRLLEVFGKYFDAKTAQAFAHKPEAIANRVYANRLGNRSSDSGDGWAFRGRSHVQLTFRDNYRKIGQIIGVDLEATPALAMEIPTAARIAAAYWKDAGLNALADQHDVLSIGRRINLGTTRTTRLPNGHDDRIARTKRAAVALGVR